MTKSPTMVSTSTKIIFGGGVFGSVLGVSTPEEVEFFLKVLEKEGIKVIDTAQGYDTSEELLGQTGSASRFIIDTKYSGGLNPGAEASKEVIVKSGEDSLKKLQTGQVDIYYIHGPDRYNPLEPILAGIDALHKAGAFKRFGLSNYSAEEVDEVVRVCTEKDYVLPTAYQGLYNAFARRTETELFPTLRKHGIAFYAYSPIAGGFLTKTPEELIAGGKGRWDSGNFLGQMYNAMYKKPGMLKALKMWGDIAAELGITKGDLAYRWVTYNSILDGEKGDGVIIGARTIAQLEETLAGLKHGPLSEEVVAKINGLWKLVEEESPLDNLQALMDIRAPAQK